MKIIILFYIFLLTTGLSANNFFKTTYSFKNVSVNYLDWSSETEKETYQKDFTYLELEGGSGFSWGEFYMFVDFENPTESWNNETGINLRVAFKPVLDIDISKGFALHIQDYNLQSKEFFVSNLVLGVSYKINTDFGLWIRPFLGPHYQESTYYSGMNGYMAGWTFVYNVNIKEQKFSVSQWHEFTFDRDENDGYEDDFGTQGALAFWWHPIDKITTGVQYRYADSNLGEQSYQEALIYSLKYNF